MNSQQNEVVKFAVRNEIKDWFQMLVMKTYDPPINISIRSDEIHFRVYTDAVIYGDQKQIQDGVEFIMSTRETINYKMPWLNENTYYVRSDVEEKTVDDQLEAFNSSDYELFYICSEYNILGFSFRLYNFRPNLDDNQKLELDTVFKSCNDISSVFITYPETRAINERSLDHMASYILTPFHGSFLPHLSLEDVLSLEMANKSSNYGIDLEHDIQRYLQYKYPALYKDTKDVHWNVNEFRQNNVLRYFILKYHACLETVEIPNILPESEINQLSEQYKITMRYQKINHIDFVECPKYDVQTYFCAIYHFDARHAYVLDYAPKYASEQFSINYNEDGSLGQLTSCPKRFTRLVLRGTINDLPPDKINSMLKCVSEHFKGYRKGFELILNNFDLNYAHIDNLSSLLFMMRHGTIIFDSMSLNIKTLDLILRLELSKLCRFVFIKCYIDLNSVPSVSRNCYKTTDLTFYNMSIDIPLLYCLAHIQHLKVINCHLLCTRTVQVPIYSENTNEIWFIHCRFDVSTLIRVMHGLQSSSTLTFLSCNLTPGQLSKRQQFIIRNKTRFINMVFEVQTVYRIFEHCQFGNRITFQNCHFCLDEFDNFARTTVKVEFQYAKFDSPVLYKIFEILDKNSEVVVYKSSIIPFDGNIIESLPHSISISLILFDTCRLELPSFFHMLHRLSKTTKVHFGRCHLFGSSIVAPCTLSKISNITFCDMKLGSKQLLSLWAVLSENSSVCFRRCELISECDEDLDTISIRKKFNIQFTDMTIPSEIVRPLLQSEAMIGFNNCCPNFMANVFPHSKPTFRAYVKFQDTSFDLSTHLRSFGIFTAKSKLQFWNCHFEFTNYNISNTVIKPTSILFYRTSFESSVLVALLDRISEHAHVSLNECDIRPKIQEFFIQPFRILSLHFVRMHLEIETILWILKKFRSLSVLQFENCKLLCSNLDFIPTVKIGPTVLYFRDMDIDARIFQSFIQTCSKRVTVSIEKCDFIMPDTSSSISKMSIDIERIKFVNVNYSSGLLHILKHLNGQFIVEYHGQLSNNAIIEICISTPVRGDRFKLTGPIYTKTVFYELISEYFRPSVLNNQIEIEVDYEPPTHLIPQINTSGDQNDWDGLKIKFNHVNDEMVKLEFFRNGTPIDLYYELNDLSDDSGECAVDYY